MAWDQESQYQERPPYNREDSGECSDCQECNCSNDERCSDCNSCCAPSRETQRACSHQHQSVPAGGNQPMNKVIAALYEKTADAVLVTKYYGHEIRDNDVQLVQLEVDGVAEALLAKAQAKQDEEDARKNVVSARITE